MRRSPAPGVSHSSQRSRSTNSPRVDDCDPELADAAVRLQKVWRGYAARKEVTNQQQLLRERFLLSGMENDADAQALIRNKYNHLWHRLPLDFTVRRLEYRTRASVLHRELFMYLPFLVTFIIFFLWGRSFGQGYFTIKAARDLLLDEGLPVANSEVEKYYEDIANVGDWYDWFKGVVVRQLWTDDFDFATTYKGRRIRYVIGMNQLLGTLRVRTLRESPESCELLPEVVRDERYPKDCYEDHTTEEGSYGENGMRYHFTQCDDLGGSRTTGRTTKRYHCGGYVMDLPFSKNITEAFQFADDLRTGHFVDAYATRFVIVEFYTYTPQFDTFTAWKLFMEVQSGGNWWPNAQLSNFNVWSKVDAPLLKFFDICFFCYVIWFWYRWVADIRRVYIKEAHYGSPMRAVFAYIFNVWNFLEIVNLVTFIIVLGLLLWWWSKSQNLPAEFVLPFPDRYPIELEGVLLPFAAASWLNSLNTVLSFLKVLKYVQLNDNFNLLSRTLSAAQRDVVGIIGLLLLTTTAYSIAGTSLYGTELEDYRDVNTSFSTMMRMLVGDFDYVSLRNANPVVAGMFFWTYIVLALFLILNFIVGVIVEAFSHTSQQARKEDLDTQLVQGFKTVAQKLKAVKGKLLGRTTRKKIFLYGALQEWLTNRSQQDIELTLYLRLAKHQDMVLKKDRTAREKVGAEDLAWLMPQQDFLQMGALWVGELWEDLHADRRHAMQTPEQMEAQEERALIIEQCKAALRKPLFDRVDRLHSQVRTLLKQQVAFNKTLADEVKGK